MKSEQDIRQELKRLKEPAEDTAGAFLAYQVLSWVLDELDQTPSELEAEELRRQAKLNWRSAKMLDPKGHKRNIRLD